MKTIDQRTVDRIIARAQNSAMGLGDAETSTNISMYDHPTIESMAMLLVSAYHAKYDLVSIFAAAMEELTESDL